MKVYKLTESEERFAELIWQNEPIGSGDLVRLCEKEMNWKKSTTYTVLKKLCEKGIFKNENAVVSSLMTRTNTIPSKVYVLLRIRLADLYPNF